MYSQHTVTDPSKYAVIAHGYVGDLSRSGSETIALGKPVASYVRRRIFAACSRTHVEHVVGPNSADVFIHSWHPEFASLIDSAYGTALRGSLHEPIEVTAAAPSQAFSIGRAAALLIAHERQRKLPYRLVFVIRHDLLIASPVHMDSMGPNAITFPHWCCRSHVLDPAHTHHSIARGRTSQITSLSWWQFVLSAAAQRCHVRIL